MGWSNALGVDETRPDTGSTDAPRERPANSGRSENWVRRRKRKDAGPTKRLDIQGLRAVAVIAVVANHLLDWPVGGFVGVDVFFVISGFLITGHLLREDGKHGGISLLDFYRRRIRRLFPAALVVIVATVVAAWLIFGWGERLKATLFDGFFAAVFGANWRFLQTGTDYFQATGPVSPLQHYWSLSVEEQFYVVWPLVLIAVLALTKRAFAGRQHSTALAGGIAAGALTLGSLAYAAVETSSNPVGAYFSTFSRGWELGLGALLAVLAPYMRGSRRTLTALSITGLLVILVSYFTVTDSNFPFPGALLPCVGAVLVIVAATSTQVAWNPVLTNKFSTYVGDISYSVYVIHFPVVILGRALIPNGGVLFDVCATLIIVGASMLLFTLIENPIRNSRWLRPKREAGTNVLADRTKGRSTVLAGALVVGGLATFLVAAPPPPGDATFQQIIAAQEAARAAAADDAPAAVPARPMGPAETALSGRIAAALSTASWPEMNPDFGAGTPEENRGCAQELQSAAACTWGDPGAAKTLYLVGDSTSAAYILTFAGVVGANPGWKMRAASGAGCPFADTVLNDAAANPFAGDCNARNAAIVAEIEQTKPDLVVVTSSRSDSDYTTHVTAELTKIQAATKKIVVLPAPPRTDDPVDCKTTISTPADCAAAVSSDYRSWVENEKTIATTVGGTFVDTQSWFCADGFCPVFVGTQPMKRDQVHITPGYAKLLAPVASEVFTTAGLLG